MLDVTPRTIYSYIREGRLIALTFKKNGALRIPEESLVRFLKERISQYQEDHGIVPQESLKTDEN